MAKKIISKKKLYAKLAALAGGDSVICVSRDRIDDYQIVGFVIALNEKLLLLHVVDKNTLSLMGYSVVRLRDITAWPVDDSFIPRALRLLDRKPVPPGGIDLQSWPALIAAVHRQYSLMMIETEKDAPGCAFIGKVTAQGARKMTWREVNRKGQWLSCPTKIAYRDITQVEFGDGYVEGLSRLVEFEAEG